ncbi:MAG: hypothetical protein JXB39_14345, partial [Deltaproteobacteria bacterium]|nr:hypothetical protein [Deltaproteobacteria bacterium]
DTDVDTDVDAHWTAGPDLPECTPEAGKGDLVALSGVLLGPDGPEAGLVLYERSSGVITCVGPSCDTTGAEVVCTEGVISPGLVDPHNHLNYNVLGPWRHAALYDNRYEWQSDGDYWDFREAFDAISEAWICEIMKCAELRELVSGTTSAVGSYGGDCIGLLVRNLDDANASGIDGYEAFYSASNLESRFDATDAKDLRSALSDGSYGSVLAHIAEGVDGSTASEVEWAFEIGFYGPGFAWIHATDASTAQFARMAASGTTLVWSPRSNLDLYDDTTAVDVAWSLGMPVSLSPDWTWSGSENPVAELACAWDWLSARASGVDDVTLWSWATSEAARTVGLDGVLGTLAPGTLADLAVFSWSAQPYRSVIQAGPTDVRLVIRGGEALYGLAHLVAPLATHPDGCEEVSACGEDRLLCVKAAESGYDAQTWAEIEEGLSAALAAVAMPAELDYANDLFPIWICDSDRPSCDPSSPSAGDADGDGVPDVSDDCPGAWDPAQEDYDGDGLGDPCDPCVISAETDACGTDPDDIDGDGSPNESDTCPWLGDADQADADADLRGDACDPCPDVYNPGDGGCPYPVRALQDPEHPDHPEEGMQVLLSNLVVTAVQHGVGFFAQEAGSTEWAGIFVYDDGVARVTRGDLVDVDGTYKEDYGLAKIASARTTLTGTAAIPRPRLVAPGDIATGGADADRFQSMVVQVEEVVVTDENPDAPDDFGELEVAGCLRVDDLLWPGMESTGRTLGTVYATLAGVLGYSYSNAKILPRDAADVEIGD